MLKKDYFLLTEICAEWNISLEDMRYYSENNIIKVGVKLYEVEARFYKKAFNENMEYNMPCKQEKVSGVFYIRLKEVHNLFRYKEIELSKFETDDNVHDFIELIPPEKKLRIHLDDLVITKIQKEKFEKTFDLLASKQPLRILNKNFERIEYKGKEYSFGQMQAKIFRDLFEAAKSENPWVLGKALLIDNNVSTIHLKTLFRNKGLVYKELIQSDCKGKYRLKI